ncbi:hypothetical protein GGS23DRAFT_600096 [Durotheca rogersii]|uniref:uncharacterized protein n=1 Tax=Durotheca rogersii TaxID=419775 RepID=UPI0022209C70|nr:uncharacterized protein GGS23DRAFT_600096 [Durotheca rogersii]KAI5859712.1 hypothetical protein GGS23DRAFT_600096 [Durotheca rogersii]
MKSATLAAALLVSVAIAKPHGHKRHLHPHEKRDLVTEWETVWETATVIIDESSTETIPPPPRNTGAGSPGQFFQPPSSAIVSVAAVETYPTPAAPETPTTSPTSTSVAQPTTTSIYQAPPPPPPPPAPTTTSTPSPAPVETPSYDTSPPASGGSSSGGSSADGIPYGKKYDGEITYYNAALGACGYPDEGKDDSENIVAIPKDFWDAISTATSYGINQPAHPLCDKTITISTADGKTAKAVIRDRCAGCVGSAIDVTPHAFLQLFGSLDGGRLEASWSIDG